MPVIPGGGGGGGGSTAVNIVTPNAPSRVAQMTFRQMVGYILQHNPDAPIPMVKTWLNSSYRRLIDRRLWYGLMLKGEVTVPQVYTTGSVSVTTGSATVTGTGTAWTADMVGRSFRIGLTSNRYIITAVTSATSLTIELPYANPTQGGVGYQIFLNIVNLGYNLKRVLYMVNQQFCYRFITGLPQEVLNSRDVWRSQSQLTYILASYPPAQDGSPQWEMYPIPMTQQGFPFVGYYQPPDMDDSTNTTPWGFIRSDVIVSGALVDALRYRGKNNKWYDPQTADYYEKRFATETETMMRNDDNHYLKDLLWNWSQWPLASFGADYAQTHLESGEW